MLIAVVADSHDNLPAIEQAVRAISQRGAEHILHAGDIVAPFAAKAWSAFEGPITAVFGNNDGERQGLCEVIPDIHAPPYVFTLGGRRILLTHNAADLGKSALIGVELLLCGHTHRVETTRSEGLVRVNPGEVGGWVTGRRTCAFVDLDSLAVEIVEL